MKKEAPSTTMDELQKMVRGFVSKRDWAQFHSPKNLSMCIAVEASELMEIFQWADFEEALAILKKKRKAVEDETADVLIALLAFCDCHGIDLAAAVKKKMKKNVLRYPAHKVRGKNKKYNEY